MFGITFPKEKKKKVFGIPPSLGDIQKGNSSKADIDNYTQSNCYLLILSPFSIIMSKIY